MPPSEQPPVRRAKDNERPLLEDIRLLGRILGDVIRLQEGVASRAAASTGHAIGSPADGEFADALVLDTSATQFAGVTDEDALDRWIFSGNRSLVRETWVGGRCVVEHGRHFHSDAIADRCRIAITRMLAD